MDESSAKREPQHPFHWIRGKAVTFRHLRKWVRWQGRNVPGEFLRGAANKLGSGTVTLLIVWWESRR